MRLSSHVYPVTRPGSPSGLLPFVSAARGAAPKPERARELRRRHLVPWGDEHEVAPSFAAAWKEIGRYGGPSACGSLRGEMPPPSGYAGQTLALRKQVPVLL